MRPAWAAPRSGSPRAPSAAGRRERQPSPPTRLDPNALDPPSGGFTTRPLRFRRRCFLAARGPALLGRLDRRTQRFHQVHDLGGLRRRWRLDDLAVDLGLDDAHHRLAVLVLVALRLEAVRQALDERLGHPQLFRVDLLVAFESLETS